MKTLLIGLFKNNNKKMNSIQYSIIHRNKMLFKYLTNKIHSSECMLFVKQIEKLKWLCSMSKKEGCSTLAAYHNKLSYYFYAKPLYDLFLFRRPKVKGENPDLKVS